MIAYSRLTARLVCALLVIAASVTTVHPTAQAAEATTTTAGYEFYIAFPPGHTSEAWTLYFSSAETGTITIDYPTGSDVTVSVSPGLTSSSAVPITHYIDDVATGVLSSKRVRITATVPVTAYGCSIQSATSDCTNYIPTSAWGSRYRVLSYPTTIAGNDGDRITIVGGAETTTVSITFFSNVSTGSGTFSAGQTTSSTINPGQIYTLEAPTVGQGFTGSLITSSRPVGVLAGAGCINGFGGACDTNVEMVPPVTSWGTNFYVNNYKNSKQPPFTGVTSSGSGVRIVADENATVVNITGDETVTVTLNAGEIYSAKLFQNPLPVNSSIIISTSKPVLVGHYMVNGLYNSGSGDTDGDPALSYIPPFEQFLNSYTFANVSGFVAQFVNVIIPDTAIASLRFDGASVSASNFRSIGATGWSSAQLNSSTGSHTLRANMPFGIEVYGANSADSYAYVGGANYSALSTVAALNVSASSQSGTVGQEVCIPVRVTDASDAPVPGIRVDGNISGVNGPSYINALTSTNGTADLCYQGGAAGSDSITFSANNYSTTVNVTWTLTAPVISYSPSVIQLASNVAMRSLTPTNSGGSVTSWAVSPSLPTGMTINAATGVITGTPTTNQSAASYSITATNAAGSSSATVSITIAAAQQPVISYSPSTLIFTLDSAITTLSPSTTGTFPTWSVSPTLPSGLSINVQNGAITGTPTRISASANYTVTATNSAGSSTTQLTLSVAAIAPDILVTVNSYSFAVNQAITTITPINSGSPATSWTISPALPTGLSFNSSSGQITGTPSVTSSTTTYTITATNSAGSDSTTLQIAVTATLAAPNISYSTSTYSGLSNVAMTTLTPTNSGGSASSWTISPTLPLGVNFSAQTGVISGTPTASSPETSYTVTALNSAGSDTATVTLTVTGVTTTLTLSFNVSTLRKGSSVIISANASENGRVTFYERGVRLANCRNVLTISRVATCNWKPKYHGSSSVRAVLNPTNSSYSNSSAYVVTNVLLRQSRT